MEWMDQFESIARDRPLLGLALAYIGGVLAGFTPCSYPMIPITVAFIGGKSGGSRWRGFGLSTIYVLGLAVVYSGLGAFASLTGRLFGTLSANHWVYLIVGNICLFFGLVMLDVIRLPAPAFLSRVQAHRISGHDVVSSLLMGGASALVVGSCTTPILGVLLTLVATSGSVAWGMAMLFVFAYGMGTLVILVGTFTGLLTSIPRSGMWMNLVQRAFGFIMIIVSEYFLIKTGELWL